MENKKDLSWSDILKVFILSIGCAYFWSKGLEGFIIGIIVFMLSANAFRLRNLFKDSSSPAINGEELK